MKKGLIIFILIFFAPWYPARVFAQDENKICQKRFVTLINPVRGRNLWSDKSLNPLISQHNASANYGYPATWLFQYDALSDTELLDTYKLFSKPGEAGVFLEVSDSLAAASGVFYRQDVKWSNPSNVFLSAYKQSERRKVIDTLYTKFKKEFGFYPQSVGAWWIDSYSLNYIKDKYGLKTALIVADQKTTDSYGVWGQWWGVPYMASDENILIPKKAGKGTIILQWAQRDPVLAFGEGAAYSNFSLQANDYIRNGKNTEYFKSLAGEYLDCGLEIGQVTVGMETGMEASDFHGEYLNQLKTISEWEGLNAVTMSEFSEIFIKQNGNGSRATIGDFVNSDSSRVNNYFGEIINYSPNIAFADYFIEDKSEFLNRRIQDNPAKKQAVKNWPLFIFIAAAFYVTFKKGMVPLFAAHLIFILTAFALLYRSGGQFGFEVFYIPNIKYLYSTQIAVYMISFAVLVFFARKFGKKFKDFNLFNISLILSFGLEGLLSLFRFTNLDGSRIAGIMLGKNKLLGISLNGLSLKSYEPGVINNFIKIPIEKSFTDLPIMFIANPILHLILGYLIYKYLLVLKIRLRIFILFLLIIFYCIYINMILSIDPVLAVPLT